VSFSWVDPHFAELFAQREEARLAERLTRCLRAREGTADYVPPAPHRELTWIEQDMELRGRIRLG
jgi:hypothetical protein